MADLWAINSWELLFISRKKGEMVWACKILFGVCDFETIVDSVPFFVSDLFVYERQRIADEGIKIGWAN